MAKEIMFRVSLGIVFESSLKGDQHCDQTMVL
jgi:hypothetical protein